MARWVEDGFITYGLKGWHYFPVKNKISACAQVLAHQRGWDKGVEVLPEGVKKTDVCKKCGSVARNTVPVAAKPPLAKETRCGKIEYFNQAEADIAMAAIRRKRQNANIRGERKSYFCKSCSSWHLTSKE